MIENITEAIEGLTVFPEPGAVFVPEQLGLARFMDPLVTIDLSLVNPKWSGVVHLLSPVEPSVGLVGMRGGASWNDLVRENWLAFSVEDGRYRFLAAENYFTLPQLAVGEPALASADWGAQDDDWADLPAYYARQRASFDATRTYYRKRFEFVAAVAGYNYRDSGADWILLFYQPEEQLALITFDWS